MFDTIKKDLPNFPDEVIRDWLEPFAKGLGWPPTKNVGWVEILIEPLHFWQNTAWNKEKINPKDLPLTEFSTEIIKNIREFYDLGIWNLAMHIMGRDGQQKYINSIKYIIEHGIFRNPIILLKRKGGYDIVDGNHRFLAWFKVEKEFKQISKTEQVASMKKLENKWGVKKIISPSSNQEAWVASQC